MKVLVLAPHPFFQNRGTPIAVKMLLETLIDSGHQVTLLTFPEGEDVEIPSCQIIRLKELSWVKGVKPGFSWKKLVYDWCLFFSLRRILQTERFDLIHAVEESAFLAAWFGKKHNIPFIYDMDSSLPHQLGEKFAFLKVVMPLMQFFEKGVVERAVGVLPVCRAIEDVVKSYGTDVLCRRLEDVSLLPADNVEVLPESAILGMEEDALIIMYVGNLEKYQGIDLLLDAFVLASQEEDRARLVIIGGSDRDTVTYRKKAETLGIGQSVHFTGRRPVTDLHYYLHQADILVSPRSKGFNTPMKIYSYLDSGRVVLATKMSTHTQVLDDEIAYLVEPVAPAMAIGFVELMKNDDLRKSLAAKAKERVQEEYTTAAFEQKLNNFYGLVADKIM
jgi:glycosyltransferase involved in cell wall biosynthesis